MSDKSAEAAANAASVIDPAVVSPLVVTSSSSAAAAGDVQESSPVALSQASGTGKTSSPFPNPLQLSRSSSSSSTTTNNNSDVQGNVKSHPHHPHHPPHPPHPNHSRPHHHTQHPPSQYSIHPAKPLHKVCSFCGALDEVPVSGFRIEGPGLVPSASFQNIHGLANQPVPSLTIVNGKVVSTAARPYATTPTSSTSSFTSSLPSPTVPGGLLMDPSSSPSPSPSNLLSGTPDGSFASQVSSGPPATLSTEGMRTDAFSAAAARFASPFPPPFAGSSSSTTTTSTSSGGVGGAGTATKSKPQHNHNCILSALYAGLKNFGIGVGLKMAVALARHLMMFKFPTLRALWNQDSFRFGLFLGGFAGAYKAINCLIHATLKESGRLPSFVSGALAAGSIFFLPPSERPSIAVYLFVRAMAIIFHAARHQAWYPASLKDFKHGDVVLMCLSACQILFAYIFEQDTLPKSYLKFLLAAGRQDNRLISAVAATGRNEPINTVALDSYILDKKITPAFRSWESVLDPATLRPIVQQIPACALMHPNQSCMTHYVSFVLKHFFQYSLRFYVPLNIVSVAIFRNKQLFTSPGGTFLSLVKSCFRSSAFLALYCGNAWFMCCLLRTANILNGLSTWLLVGPVAGAALALESKSRRLELAIYCMSPALQSFYKCFRKWNLIPKIHYIDYIFFAVAMGIIMSGMQNDHHHMLYYYPSLSKIMKSLVGIDPDMV